ncbi:MAG: histidine phosphatase family protein [Candidatus Riflebacteria bacterium]|nr:histidine phosphatase family protein [Candidatus Riflebacteria bacterium]
MKTLLLLRHAKSSWDRIGVPDVERPLAPRGRRDAPRIARALQARGPVPDLIVCSPAVRARQTVELLVEAVALRSTLQVDASIYEAGPGRLVEVVQGLPDASDPVMLVGHNPGLEELVERLTGMESRMPTASLARIDLAIERWSEARSGQGKLAWLLRPKEL